MILIKCWFIILNRAFRMDLNLIPIIINRLTLSRIHHLHEHLHWGLSHRSFRLHTLQSAALSPADLLLRFQTIHRPPSWFWEDCRHSFQSDSSQARTHPTGRAVLSVRRRRSSVPSRSQNCRKHHKKPPRHPRNHLSHHACTVRDQQLWWCLSRPNRSLSQNLHQKSPQSSPINRRPMKKITPRITLSIKNEVSPIDQWANILFTWILSLELT